MTKLILQTKSAIDQHHRKLFISALFALAAVLCLYFYFWGTLMSEMVDKKNNEIYLRSASMEYQEFELDYYKVLGELDIEYAKTIGFIESGQSHFAVRHSSVAKR